MRVAAASRHRRSAERLTLAIEQILNGQREILDRLERVERLVARGRGARDAADVHLIAAIAARGSNCTTSEVFRHAAVAPDVAAALADAGVENPQQLGKLFARVEGIVIDGIRVERTGAIDREGVVWGFARETQE